MIRFWRLHKIDVAVAAVFTAITQYEIWIGPSPVSYTHLTLPTILLV